MRLLHHLGDGHFRLEDFAEDNKPDYAILSHTWLLNGREVTFDDLEKGNAQRKTASYDKIRFCVEQAAKDGLDYSWVDTCCINKSSSAELQEAITTMFTWYRHAAKCYVYLPDISATEGKSDNHPMPWESAFRRSRWFKRGWTLQELIAPDTVEFFSAEGIRLGDKQSLSDLIHQVTGIPHQALQGADMDSFSVAERLSWMQDRQTKRKEDMAYSMLGIFGIFMPLMYGEGTHASTRLHEEIQKKHKAGARINELLSKLPVVPQAAFNSIENQYAATCLPNTRVELLQEIIDWVDGPDKRCIFWLNGIAGTGKSTVAQTICRLYQDRGNLGGSFFFSKGGGDSSLADKFVTTLASQISTKIPQVKQSIYDAITRQPNIAAHSLRDQWDQLILKALSRSNKHAPSTILFVIDALDECASERDIRIILKLITSSQSLTNIRLRILITSRPETPIRCGFSQISEAERQVFVLHEILPAIVDRDLNLFFEHNFMAMREERGFADDWPGMQIIKKLVEISGGLFIWASTACRYIREGRRLAARRISTLINGHCSGMGPEKQLDQIYTTVLRATVEQDYSDEEKKELYGLLRDVLGSITILFSPLSVSSLSNLIPTSSSDITETLADLHTIFQIPDQMDRVIRSHHPTFRDFLFNQERCSDLNFWVDEKQAHKTMAENCIQLMSKVLKRDICGLQLPGTLLENIEPKLIKEKITPELEYACRYWVHHYRESGVVLRDGDKAHHFFEEFFLNWFECMALTGNGSEVPSIVRSYASLLSVSVDILAFH
jgi:ABC-type oligopeptide transport system ATPase subunit